MVAKGEFDLLANRSHRRLPTLLSVRAHQHEAVGMIRDPRRAHFHQGLGRCYLRSRM